VLIALLLLQVVGFKSDEVDEVDVFSHESN
jgi:hypothetical protein